MGGVVEFYTRRVCAVYQRCCARSHFFDDRDRLVILFGERRIDRQRRSNESLGARSNLAAVESLLRGQRVGTRRAIPVSAGVERQSRGQTIRGLLKRRSARVLFRQRARRQAEHRTTTVIHRSVTAARRSSRFGRSSVTVSFPLRWVEHHPAARCKATLSGGRPSGTAEHRTTSVAQ